MQTGVYEAEVINENQIKIDGNIINANIGLAETERASVLVAVDGNIIFLEKITPALIDETTLKQKLNLNFIMPATGVINSVFGPRRDPISGNDEFHEGIDISNDIGTDIYAIEDGRIIETKIDDEHYGNCIIIIHEGNVKSIYAHLDEILIKKGIINKGQLIGKMGDTGKSSGPHLHLGLEYNGKYLNPRVFYGKGRMLLGQHVTAME